MVRVYIGDSPADAHSVRLLLEQSGIRARVLGEHLWAMRGGLAADSGTAPSVWVLDEDAARLAAELIGQHHQRPARATSYCPACRYDLRGSPGPRCPECGEQIVRPPPWICPACGQEIEGQFEECWHCAQGGEAESGGAAPTRSRRVRV